MVERERNYIQIVIGNQTTYFLFQFQKKKFIANRNRCVFSHNISSLSWLCVAKHALQTVSSFNNSFFDKVTESPSSSPQLYSSVKPKQLRLVPPEKLDGVGPVDTRPSTY